VSFRTRLFVGLLAAVLLPLTALAFGVRREMDRRLTAEYQARVVSMAQVVQANLGRESAGVAGRLATLASDLRRSNRFRLATLQADPSARRYLLDYAGDAMRLSGLAMLQVQDSTGRILSSGHFRNEFDQLQPELPRLLARAGALTLVRSRTPEAPLLTLARVDSFEVGGRRFDLVGGIAAEAVLLGRPAPDSDLAVRLLGPGEDGREPGGRVLRLLSLPYVDLLSGSASGLDTARVVITQSLDTLRELQRSVDRWFLLALALTVGLALALAGWLSSMISRPLTDLARKTADIDLDRLDQSFETRRTDEIGSLSRLLGGMTERLRSSAAALREAERRAAMGDLARQVNHDIKNGLAPIRNVLRHLSSTAGENPVGFAEVYQARRSTLESSVDYLEKLAQHYARLSPGLERRPCDVNVLVDQVLRNTSSDGAELRAQLSPKLPPVLGDSLVVRRILENLIGNAVDSLAGTRGGVVTVSTRPVAGDPSQVLIGVSDTGPGMSRDELDRAFNDFYTTKPGGTGLGLSIVRRLVLDLNGTLRVETEPGAGTRVTVELPADFTPGRAAQS
jgi:signal transduction histidine kinase